MTRHSHRGEPDEAEARRHFVRAPRAGRTRAVKESTALRILHDVLGLQHLHYGLWEGETLDRAGLEAAQSRYADRVEALIPADARSLLDVGAGTGAMARRLVDRGFEVEGLSPDPHQMRLFRERVGRPFHLGRFQEFVPPHEYDVLLMSESAQYIWLHAFFPSVLRAAPGGSLVIADYFRRDDAQEASEPSGHPMGAFLRAARDAGCTLEHREDITEGVLPTLALARSWLDRHVEPAIRLTAEVAERRYPLLSRLAAPFVRPRARRLDDLRRLLDPEAFRRSKTYELLRFRVPA